MPKFFLRFELVAILALLMLGCAPATPQQRLAGRWKGTPEVKEAVDEMVQSATPGQEVNPLAQGAARFLGKALAKATMSVEIDLRPSGAVFLRGNTDLLGLPADSDGSWTVLSADDDVAHVEFEIEDQTFQAKIVFRDTNEFTLKMETPDTPATDKPAEKPAATLAEKPAVAARDEDKDYEDDDPPAQPTVPKAVRPAAKPAPEAPAKKQATSIIFKRDSG